MTQMSGRPLVQKILALSLALVTVAGLIALGVWQLQRREWKHQLIQHVQERVHAEPVNAPDPDVWLNVNEKDDEYRRVILRGVYLKDKVTLVQTTTRLGYGFWVMCPLQADTGFTVLINRGFIPYDMRSSTAVDAPEGEATVNGLLRMSEPEGGLMRQNEAQQNLWYSRDIRAIADALHVAPVAPYYIDQDALSPDGWPRGGMTNLQFIDNHLVYALTWFGLALVVAGGTIKAVIDERRSKNSDI